MWNIYIYIYIYVAPTRVRELKHSDEVLGDFCHESHPHGCVN